MRRLAILATCIVALAPARAGHDDVRVDPALKRYGGQITQLGAPDPQGRIYSFRAKRLPEAPGGYVPDELQGWRLTMLAGKRFASAFEVRGNSAVEITVSEQGEPLNGIAVNDVFVVEEIAIAK